MNSDARAQAVPGDTGGAGATTWFIETLGDINTDGCDIQWADGECEDGWNGWGDEETVRMVTAVGTSPTVYSVEITPGTSFWNGVSRELDAESGDFVTWTVPVTSVGGTAAFSVRAEFKSATGRTLSVQSATWTLESDDMGMVTAYFERPSIATDVEVFIGAKDGSSPYTRVMLGCLPGVGGCEWSYSSEAPPASNPANPCPDTDCGCTNTCPAGSERLEICSVDPVTCEVTDRICTCRDAEVPSFQDWQL